MSTTSRETETTAQQLEERDETRGEGRRGEQRLTVAALGESRPVDERQVAELQLGGSVAPMACPQFSVCGDRVTVAGGGGRTCARHLSGRGGRGL